MISVTPHLADYFFLPQKLHCSWAGDKKFLPGLLFAAGLGLG